MMGTILSVHVDHKTALLSEMEQIGGRSPEELLLETAALPGVTECAVLKTCNRIELYTVTDDRDVTLDALDRLIRGMLPTDPRDGLVVYREGTDTARHILRVASGLESMVVGENQIQGQVKGAYEMAIQNGTMGGTLSMVFRKAISVGKRIRTETGLSKGEVSIGSVAVELAESQIGSLRNKNILVIGAGDMATLIMKHLAGREPKAVFVSNRTHARAQELAKIIGGRAIRFDDLMGHLEDADVVLCATSAIHMLITRERMERAMKGRQKERGIIIIDVSFPRNVEPDVALVPGVRLFDIDGLRGRAEINRSLRQAEAIVAERTIDSELERLNDRIRERDVDELLSRLYMGFNSLKENEVQKALNRLTTSKEPLEKVLDDLASSLTNKLLANPTSMLKEASRRGDAEVLAVLRDLFDMGGDMDVSKRPA